MKIQNKKILVILLLLVAVDVSAKENRKSVVLTGGNFSQWRDNTGQWQIAGNTFVKPDNNKLLSSKSGTGVIVNGPAGRTSHLFSKDEFGDVKAHFEFMVSKDSNSGVYFMGRYEIQVFDSWQKKPQYP